MRGILSVVSINPVDPVVYSASTRDVMFVLINVEVSVLPIDVAVSVKPQLIHVRVIDKIEVSVLVLMFQCVYDLALDDELEKLYLPFHLICVDWSLDGLPIRISLCKVYNK